MKHILVYLLLLPLVAGAQPPVAFNMTLHANLDLPNLPSQSGFQYSDVWGYRAPNGTEVAIIGLIEAILFVDVTNPAFPVIIYEHEVMNMSTSTVNHSLWRDFDTYQNYIYAVSDQQTAGLIIFDMTNVPASVSLVYQSVSFFNRSHTLFIDQPNGRLYAAGTNSQANGLKILDIQTNPAAPVQVGAIALNTVGGGYVHDVFVRDNIAYCSHGSLHKIQMYDFSNLPSFTVVGVIENYPEPGYNHSSWLDESGDRMVFCDETFGSDVKLVDVSDPLNISADDFNTFYSELLGPGVAGASVAHNPYIVGDLAYISYYEEGVQVFDISDPENITLYAYYDTKSNTQYNGFTGCWGVYPFFPSGTILGSDMNNGLYIMEIQSLILDINFISFQATRKKQGIQLDWTVGDVSNGNKFEVKRSLDNGTTFETIGTVKLASPQSHYTYLDENVFPQHKYVYRIDFVEFDGRKVKSPVRSVTAGFSEITLKVVNPTSSNLVIDLMKPVEALQLKLFDLEGRLVWSHDDDNPGAHIEKDISEVIPGHYVLTANWAGGNENMLIQVVK